MDYSSFPMHIKIISDTIIELFFYDNDNLIRIRRIMMLFGERLHHV